MPDNIVSLRQERARVYTDFAAIQAGAEDAGRAMTAEETARFDQLEAQIQGFDTRIRAAERAQALRAETAVPARTVPLTGARDQRRQVEQVLDTGGHADEPGIAMAQFTRALIVGRGNVTAAAEFAASTFGEDHQVTAALQANDFKSGGALVPEQMASELIDLLRPRTVVRRNSTVVPLVGGTDTFPTVEKGTSAYYIGEGTDIPVVEPEFGALKFVEREIAALVPISNKLLRHASISVDLYIRNDLVSAFAQAEDLAFLRGTGLGAGPKGIRYLAKTIIAANGTVNLANIDADARAMELALLEANILMINPRWVMAPRVFAFLRDLRDGNGNLVYPSLSLASPTWKGFPVERTNNVPVNFGAGANESELTLIDFSESTIAESYQVRIDASETASYRQNGEVVSAFGRNQTVIRALAAHDYGLKRKAAAAILTGVKWGAA